MKCKCGGEMEYTGRHFMFAEKFIYECPNCKNRIMIDTSSNKEKVPAPQSAREVAHFIRMEEPSGYYDTAGYEEFMAERIEAYAESRVQEELGKVKQERKL